MSSVRTMLERVRRLEAARTAPKSPLEVAFGSYEAFAAFTHEQIEAGQLDRRDMIGEDGNSGILGTLRMWHETRVWGAQWRRNRIWEYSG